MKIFILAFCIFQISLAQVRIVAPPRPIGKFVAQKPADRINYDFEANFYFLSDLVSKLKRFPQYAELANALEKLLKPAKSVAGGFSTAGITFKTIDAFVIFNLYADVLNGLNVILNPRFTPNRIRRASLSAGNIFPKISIEIFKQLEDDYRQLVRAVDNLDNYKDLFVNNFDSFGQSIPYYIDLFAANTVDGLAQTIDPEASQIIGNSVGTLKTQIVDVVTNIVDKGTPLGEVVWEIIQNGAYSILDSYGQLILAAKRQLNKSK